MATPARILSIVLAWTFIIWVSAYAWRLGSADSMVHESIRTLNAWTTAGTQPALADWLEVRNTLERASLMAPDDPTPREHLGILHARRGTQESMELAHAYFSQSLGIRPSSPYSWASLAAARYALGKTDATFESALVNAVLLGPSEAEVQATVADFGLAVWDEVQPATRVAIEAAVHSGMRRNPMEMLRILQRRGRLEMACRFIGESRRGADSKWLDLCDRKVNP